MRWTTLWKERGQTFLEFTNTFHTLHTKLGIKDFEWHLVLKYCGALHRYIQNEMDFLDISSLDVAYRCVVKIEKKFKHQKKMGVWVCKSAKNQSMIKMTLTNSLLKTSPSHRKRKFTERQRRTPENGAISTKSPSTTLMNVSLNNHWWSRSKTRCQTLIQNMIMKVLAKYKSSTLTQLLLSWAQQFNQKNQYIMKRGRSFFIHRCGWRGPWCNLLLIVEARRTSSQQRLPNSWDCQQHHTYNHTTLGGFARDEISMSANSGYFHTTSNPSRMQYYVIFPHWMSVIFSWANHMCGISMLFMSLDPKFHCLSGGSYLQNTRGSSNYCST